MSDLDDLDYERLLDGAAVAEGSWERAVDDILAPAWLRAYAAATGWEPEVLEISQGELVFLFDAAPTRRSFGEGEDRVVVVWGRSAPADDERDRRRLAGFLPEAQLWSGRGRDRGHLIAHAAGGGLDMNIAPQLVELNRGRSAEGRRWRAHERAAAQRPGTPMFVRPLYSDGSWVASSFEYGLVLDGVLRVERFANAPPPAGQNQPCMGG